MIRTQILLTPSLYELLKIKAEQETTSISALVREAVEKLIVPKKRTSKEILKNMARHAFSDPHLPKDIATNDEYLYGKKKEL